MKNLLKTKKILLGVFCWILVMSPNSFAIQKQLSEIKKLVNSGTELIKKVGTAKAYKEFNNKNGKYVQDNNYLFVYNFQGDCLVHGNDPQKYVGKNWLSYRDKLGTPVIKLLIAVAKSGDDLVGYYWENPKTRSQDFKISYVKAIDNNTLIGSGIFIK